MPSPQPSPVERLLDAAAVDLPGRRVAIDAPACAADVHYGDTSGPADELTPELLAGARVVVLALPKSLGGLDDYAERIAAWAPDATLVAAGRNQHMTPSMNDVLARHYEAVQPQRGVGKCRAIVATGAKPAPLTWPRAAAEPMTGLTLVAHGLTFGGPRLDAGTRLLLTTADRWPTGDAVDVGCGNGILTAYLARRGDRVTGVDLSRAAVASTRATLAANGLQATVELGDGLGGRPAASADLVVTNPPFHAGTAKDSTPALAMIADAARVLRPSGELYCVFNSHLPYLAATRAAFGSADVVARDRAYTVLRAVRRLSLPPGQP